MCWVFVSVRGLSLVVASGGHSSSRCAGLSSSRPLLLRSTGSRRAGSVVVAHGPCCSAACGILPEQGSNPCALHWQADSQLLRHQGSWELPFLKSQKTAWLQQKWTRVRGESMVNLRQYFSDFLTDKNSQGSLFKMWILGQLSSKKGFWFHKSGMESGIYIFKKHTKGFGGKLVLFSRNITPSFCLFSFLEFLNFLNVFVNIILLWQKLLRSVLTIFFKCAINTLSLTIGTVSYSRSLELNHLA